MTLTKIKTERLHSPQPEMIGRADQEHGRWTVGDSPATRGIPHTDLHNRKMVAPHGEDELDRVIRGHEMMHAKVSPAPTEWLACLAREVASEQSLRAVEEARVNSLCNRVNIPVAKYLSDGTEKIAGKKLAESDDLTALVHGAVGTAGTIGGTEFIKGVRSVNKVVAKVMANIQKQVMKHIDSVHMSELAKVPDGTTESGFAHTERIAEWVDTLINKMEEEKEENKSKGESESESESESKSESDTELGEPIGVFRTPKTSKPMPTRDLSDPTKSVPRPARGIIPEWGKLRIKKLVMPDATRGNLGKKRIASDTGKNPRRMHRYLTDRKVFDRTSKGLGGVVLIDASGSMSFDHNDIRDIVEAAPGCTVAMYTEVGWSNESSMPNLWILAEKGRICKTSDMPDHRSGNVVDYPALKWAVKQRQRSVSPVIWVSDGGVTGVGDVAHEALSRQVGKYVTHERVLVVGDVAQAKVMLGKLRNNVKVARPEIPSRLRR